MTPSLFRAGRLAAALAYAALLLPGGASAQWPQKPVTIVVPYSPGGITDQLARIVAEALSRAVNQPVVVQNVTGAGGHIGGATVARATPDGHTLLMAAGVMIVGSPNTEPDIVKYDTQRDLAPIAFVAELPVMMVVHPSLPGATLREFTAWARAHGDRLNCASTGVGTGGHLACLQFAKLAGTAIAHIAYKGAPDANLDLLANRVQIYFGVLPTQIGFVREGRQRALGVATEQRLAAAPDVPTLREQGFPLAFPAWNGLFAPGGTPGTLISSIDAIMRPIMADPQVRDRILKTQSVMRDNAGPDDLRALIAQDFTTFKNLAVEAGLRKP